MNCDNRRIFYVFRWAAGSDEFDGTRAESKGAAVEWCNFWGYEFLSGYWDEERNEE